MYKKALEVLDIFYKNGYEAYIVGGYPRDMILGIDTKDIDICTNARPVDIIRLFDIDKKYDNDRYGSIKICYKKYKYDVTSFRKDIKYEKNRKPIKIKYIDDIKKDLLRRDFTINTLCIDKDGKLIDLLNIREDIDKKVIRTVGNPRYRLKEDALRILRAIRFAALLDFKIDEKTKNYIVKYGYLLNNLSSNRKKMELDKIFSSKGKEYGRELIIELGLDKYLGLDNLKDIVMCDDIIGIWSQLDLKEEYIFSKIEKDMISKIKDMMGKDINRWNIYRYGLYVSTVVGSIKGVSYKKINQIYRDIDIYSKKDIDINGKEIGDILKGKDKRYIGVIYDEIEKKIVDKELINDKKDIIRYIMGRL